VVIVGGYSVGLAIKKSSVRHPAVSLTGNTFGQVVYTRVPLSV